MKRHTSSSSFNTGAYAGKYLIIKPRWTPGASRQCSGSDSALFVQTFHLYGFLSPFGDIPLWNILASCMVLPYLSPYPGVTTLMLGGHLRSVAPEPSSRSGGDRLHLDTS